MTLVSYDVPPSKIFRTPEERFFYLHGFPYEPRYAHLGNLRYAFIDESSGMFHDGRLLAPEEIRNLNISQRDVVWETFLCFHGQPTWSYLYRRMIPVFMSHPPKGDLGKKYVRRRILAPDYFGCGRSDKPIDDTFYTFEMHQDYLINFVRRHVIEEGPASSDTTLVMQDWGGILGFTLLPIFPNLFTRLFVMNTGLGLGKPPSQGWMAFHDFIKRSPNANVGQIIARGTPHLTSDEISGYDAPHPDHISKASVRRFPPIVPREPDMPGVPSSFAAVAYLNRLSPSQMRVFVVMGLKDPVLGELVIEGLIRVAFGRTGTFVYKHPDAGHFVQEWGGPITELILDTWSTVHHGLEHEAKLEGVEWRAPLESVNSKL